MRFLNCNIQPMVFFIEATSNFAFRARIRECEGKSAKAKEQKCEHVMAKHEGKSVKVKEQYYYPSFAFHTTTFALLSLCLLITDNLMEVSKSP